MTMLTLIPRQQRCRPRVHLIRLPPVVDDLVGKSSGWAVFVRLLATEPFASPSFHAPGRGAIPRTLRKRAYMPHEGGPRRQVRNSCMGESVTPPSQIAFLVVRRRAAPGRLSISTSTAIVALLTRILIPPRAVIPISSAGWHRAKGGAVAFKAMMR
ncbi:hypothetical protein BJ912DRAFT_256159 [Pholiota molesta]|nr:hypothetical protein BJ912DRAFT_256159 [Pholiota molesta]